MVTLSPLSWLEQFLFDADKTLTFWTESNLLRCFKLKNLIEYISDVNWEKLSLDLFKS